MLVFILVVSFVWGVFNLIKKFYDVIAIRVIRQVSDVKQAVIIRRRLLKLRMVTLYLWLGILIVSVFVIYSVIYSQPGVECNDNDVLSFLLNFFVCATILYIQISSEKSKTDIYGNLSYFTADEYIARDEEFYLYLRGFEDDTPFKESGKHSLKFDESLLAEAVEYGTGAQMCALGMTYELDSPIGAQRVYVNDDNWQEKVLMLMQKAKQIFILINNRKSCLWEIEQAAEMKDKIVFIVDSREKYDYVRGIYGAMFNMPEPPANTSDCFFFRSEGEATHFDSTISGYLTILNRTLEEVEAEQLANKKSAHRAKNEKLIKTLWIKIALCGATPVILAYICYGILKILGKVDVFFH